MSEAYLMSMPVIINCLGGEMIYILCSRLKAQSISQDKSIRVIKDIGNLLYNKKFQNDLFIHKKPSKHQEVKSIFETLAHSSIMRLNSTSMNKLFELMLMTLKLQILRSKYPEEIYQITINHFIGVIEIMNQIDFNDKAMINMVKEAMDNFINIYGNLSPYDYIILKSIILRFLQGKNVKVSIFIQENLQETNSILFLPMNEESPPFVGKSGIVKDKISGKEDYYELKLSKCYIENKNNDRLKNFTTNFGKNMFGINSLHLIGREKIKKKEDNKEEYNDKNIKEKIEPKNGNNDEKASVQLNENTPPPVSSNTPLNNKEDKNKNKKEEKKEKNIIMKTDEYKIVNEIKDSVFIDNSEEDNELSLEQKKIISQGNKKDFSLFTSVFAENGNREDEIFEFDLFGNDKVKDEKNIEEDFINIKNTNNDIKSKMNERFGNLEKKDDDEDDLLDLMDKNI